MLNSTDIIGVMSSPLDWSRQLAQYHKLDTSYIIKFNLRWDVHAKLPRLFQQIKNYNQFINKLSNKINEQTSQLRLLPKVINNPQDT